MADISPKKVHEWNQLLDELALHFAGLQPSERAAFVRHLMARDQYEYADASLNAVSAARRELLTAIAGGTNRSQRATVSASPRRNGQGGFGAPGIPRAMLKLA